ncbi:hypothetical protein BpHYR1_022009 [Brachionus plicatilis]|uniref:Uncharacterized protein n=1 Tax=Brachionus plicatilis TaxID=10195 RepID=A0A3M7PM87_BRAPC|nr:hypothetical protein BpHYR1_022009 [Brachionus plicatilis]
MENMGISKTTCHLRSRPPNRTINGALPNQQRRRTVPAIPAEPNRTANFLAGGHLTGLLDGQNFWPPALKFAKDLENEIVLKWLSLRLRMQSLMDSEIPSFVVSSLFELIAISAEKEFFVEGNLSPGFKILNTEEEL